jgi:uncharacterized FAD-dependent dehydrogenase
MGCTPAFRTWRVLNLEQAIGEPDVHLRERACRAAGVDVEVLHGFRIGRRSLDARRRGGMRRLRFIVHVDLVLEAGYDTPALAQARRAGRVHLRPEPAALELPHRDSSMSGARVVVVGAGPAGLLAALTLALNGVRIDLLDRGPSLPERGRAVSAFERTRTPDPEANLLFGEGGAGTYSDGKLYTRVDHPLESPILAELVACGAPPEIAFDARAHIGTDRLHRVVAALRRRMQGLGVRFHWKVRLEGLSLEPGSPRRVSAVQTSAGELPCDAVILALGHSARDTLAALHRQAVAMEARPFQLGVRIEHPQPLIDAGCHGIGPEVEQLGAASYRLVSKAGHGVAGVHSFCMCPGGRIVACVNEPGLLCTNGMSNSRRSSPWASASLVTTLGPSDCGSGCFAGVDLQRRLERAFFEAGGCDYTAPAQRAPDFLSGRESRRVGPSSYKLGVRPGRIDALLPPGVCQALRRSLERFDRQIPGFAGPDGLLVGLESRASSPLRLRRDDATRRAAGFANLFPVGEGAGYAGGIMSSAIDGARSAQALLSLGC